MNPPGEQFLHQQDSRLHTSGPVEHEQTRKKSRGDTVSPKPTEKIADWFKILEQTHLGHRENPRVLERIRKYYYDQYLIKPKDIPESTFLLEQRIARELGHGDIEITQEFKDRKIKQIIDDQKTSLDRWLNYLTSPDAQYPLWAKYWAFTSMLGMGMFEKIEKEEGNEIKEFGQFTKRRKDTVASFPMLNPRALAMTISAITSRIEQKQKPKQERQPITNVSVKLDDPAWHQLLTTENFSKIYAQFLIEMPEYSEEGLKETKGVWKIYKQGSDAHPLVDSLEGYPLEWCTANLDTAQSQLQGGDFHVYYSYNQQGNPVIPRVAIRMAGNNIAEVRGIAHNQNLDPYISDVVSQKMDAFPDGKVYQKKSADMKRLTEIEEKNTLQKPFSVSDLRFLYQLDAKIQGFGYQDDPRIQEIIANRDIESDLSIATGYSKDQISITQDEALKGGIKFHYGNLNLGGLTSAEGLKLPDTMGGNLYLNRLTSAAGLKLPDIMGGNLYLSGLTSAEKEILRRNYPNLEIM